MLETRNEWQIAGRGAVPQRRAAVKQRSCVSHLEQIMAVGPSGVSNEKPLRHSLICGACNLAPLESATQTSPHRDITSCSKLYQRN